jgi:hypothetical protein
MNKTFFSIIFFSLFVISCIPPQEKSVNSKMLTKADIIHNNVLNLDTHTDTQMLLIDS